MKALIKKIREWAGHPAVTIMMPTHRSKPDSLNDSILLKNLLTEASRRLEERFDKSEAKAVVTKLESIVNEIDHNYNLDGMVLYANKSFGDFARIPVSLPDKVFVGTRFMERPLWKADQKDQEYYVLVFSRRNARLIKADKKMVVTEFENELFPMENQIIETDPLTLTMPQGQDRLIEQFFKEIDKALWETARDERLPVVLAAEKSNQDYFRGVMKERFEIAGGIVRNRDDETAEAITLDAWTVMKEFMSKRNEERKNDISAAINSNSLITDINTIWRAVNEGRGETLFVEDDFFMPAVKNPDLLQVDNMEGFDKEKYVDDIIDEMIALNTEKGGEVVFLESDVMDDYNGLALATRY
jgi:hypothetical protein